MEPVQVHLNARITREWETARTAQATAQAGLKVLQMSSPISFTIQATF